MNIYINTMTEDDDKEVVAQACMGMADIMKECGYMVIESCKLFFVEPPKYVMSICYINSL